MPCVCAELGGGGVRDRFAGVVQLRRRAAVDLVARSLQIIHQKEATVKAWAYLNAKLAYRQAEALDRDRPRASDKPLQGIPVGVKDIFATVDMPTEWGTPFHRDRWLHQDAAVVERLRAAGAVILGKTVTTEYATAQAGKTCNPHNPSHTPGGSSSGSAAAVAAGMVPVAIGSQTMGSVVRPAAYCGVLGFKPSFGRISRYGMMPVSRSLDQVGIFARCVDDLAQVAAVLGMTDARDPDCYGGLLPLSTGRPQVTAPRLGLIKGLYWEQIDPESRDRLLACISQWQAAGATVVASHLPTVCQDYWDQVQVLVGVGIAVHHGGDYDADQMQGGHHWSAGLIRWLAQGRNCSATTYASARQAAVTYAEALAAIFADVDAIITPATDGAAPLGLNNTGSPRHCALWTLVGLPTLSLPINTTAQGLPLAVQLVGAKFDEAKLLAIARWLLQEPQDTPL